MPRVTLKTDAYEEDFEVAIVREGTRVRMFVDGIVRPFSFKRNLDQTLTIRLDGQEHVVHVASRGDLSFVHCAGRTFRAAFADPLTNAAGALGAGEVLRAPMPGRIAELRVKVGDKVSLGETLAVMESMKMHIELVASASGIVREICCATGDAVLGQAVVLELDLGGGARATD